MPRKKSNARSLVFPKKLKQRFKAMLVLIDQSNVENMSPGKLVAAAEWRRVGM